MHAPSKLLSSMRSFLTGDIMPLSFDLAWDSKLGGNRSRGRTNVLTVQGNFSGGVGSSINTVEDWIRGRNTRGKTIQRTVVPNSCCGADHFSFVLFVVHDGSNAETHDGQGRHLFWSPSLNI